MIVRGDGESLIVTRQIDHGAISGELASHWGNASFPKPLPFESVIYACGVHDEAWRYLDEEPILDESTGWPHTFMSMATPDILPAYLDGADRVGRVNPYAGFLVMMHYQGFFNRRFGLDKDLPSRKVTEEEQKSVQVYMNAAEMLRGRFRSRAWEEQEYYVGDVSAPAISHAYLILQIVDVISLFLCVDPCSSWSLGDVRRTVGGELLTMEMKPISPGKVQVHPWPFTTKSEIEVTFPIRRIPNRKYVSTEEVRSILAGARVERITFQVVSN